jgi:hypothetical protein
LRGALGADDEEWLAVRFDGREGQAVIPFGGFLYAPGGLIGIYSGHDEFHLPERLKSESAADRSRTASPEAPSPSR